MKRDGTRLGTMALCAHCKFAIQLRRDRFYDDEDKVWRELDYWTHFAHNDFTAHTAEPCMEVGWRYDSA